MLVELARLHRKRPVVTSEVEVIAEAADDFSDLAGYFGLLVRVEMAELEIGRVQ